MKPASSSVRMQDPRLMDARFSQRFADLVIPLAKHNSCGAPTG